FGKMLNTRLGYAHFWLTIVGAYGVFIPMHFIGISGAPRRYYDYSEYEIFDNETFLQFEDLNLVITIFAILAASAQLIFLFNFFFRNFSGTKYPINAWNSTIVEWSTCVEHIYLKCPGILTVVHRCSFVFSKP